MILIIKLRKYGVLLFKEEPKKLDEVNNSVNTSKETQNQEVIYIISIC